MNNFSVLAISASIGGFIGALASSLFKYYFDNKYKNEKNKETTRNVLMFIEKEIIDNLSCIKDIKEKPPIVLLGVKGPELIFLKIENLSVSQKQLTKIIKMYSSFALLNRIVIDRKGLLSLDRRIEIQKTRCVENIKEYRCNYSINDSITEKNKE